MRTLTLLLLAGLLRSAGTAAETPDVNARLKALEDKVARLAGQTPPRWATVDRDRLRNAIHALGREKLEAHKQAEKLTPEQVAQIEKYEELNQQLLRLPLRQYSPPGRSALLPPLPPANLTGGQPAQALAVVSAPAKAESDADKEREELARRVAEAKAPVATIVDRRSQITARYYAGEFLTSLVADHVRGRFDLVVEVDSRYSSDRTILYRASVNAPDITDELLQFLREREQIKPTPSPAERVK
jgi:hypothetical protein